jgi:hypothetical protein
MFRILVVAIALCFPLGSTWAVTSIRGQICMSMVSKQIDAKTGITTVSCRTAKGVATSTSVDKATSPKPNLPIPKLPLVDPKSNAQTQAN